MAEPARVVLDIQALSVEIVEACSDWEDARELVYALGYTTLVELRADCEGEYRDGYVRYSWHVDPDVTASRVLRGLAVAVLVHRGEDGSRAEELAKLIREERARRGKVPERG